MNEIELDSSVFDFVRALLSGDLVSQGRSGFSHHAVMRCAMKLQQFSGPVMAKGLEDTAFYRYNRFIALNEVGADPDQFGPPLSHFHRTNTHRAKQWPHTMLTTSTHDTKRGEDVRARLAILSEIPEEWATQVNGWSRILRARRGEIGSTAPPDRNDEYLFYQLLLGTWPAELTGTRDGPDLVVLGTYTERLKAAMIKSVREAKLHSTWKSPNAEYENAVQAFIDSALAVDSDAFYSTFLPFQERVARLGVQNSLVQLTLKLTAPGVPDIYQGSENWELSMMDPDNRRKVDYENRRQLLGCVNDRSAKEMMQNWQNGAIKMLVTAQLLALRKTEPDLFATGKYESITASGSKADCICAFERQLESKSVMVAVARFPARREADPDWGDTEIPVPANLQGKVLRNAITGAMLSQKGHEPYTRRTVRLPSGCCAHCGILMKKTHTKASPHSSAVTRRYPVGAELHAGGTNFRVWAPRHHQVEVVLRDGDSVALTAEGDGYFSGSASVAAGVQYRFRLGPTADLFPDPASRFQPEGPFGWSEVIDPAFRWTDTAWQGYRLAGQIIYEMHVGTFTQEGTWQAAEAQLHELADLGITVIEVMPLADFAGSFGWGYDGVNFFAPTRLYGRPEEFRHFVDAAHALGMGVILDVVYNHVGPAGNFLPQFSDSYVTSLHNTDWGEALNYYGEDSAPVRDFFLSNARYWIEEFHLDGLRLDATQNIYDESPVHVLEEIGVAVRAGARGRDTIIVAENESQNCRIIRPVSKGGYELDGLWNDDFHHSASVALIGHKDAYYA